MYLFLTGMMLLAELAREEGVFDWVADIAVHHARGSAGRLFIWVYGVGIAVTALLSNDATAVVLTPAVLAAVRRAKVEPRPYLLACALIANAASFLLPISNPANLVVYGTQLPRLAVWMRMFLLPSVAAVAATFVCLRLLSPEGAGGRGGARWASRIGWGRAGWLALAGIGMAAAGLLVASAMDVPLGAPTFGAGVVALVLVAMRDRSAPKNAMRNVAWSVLPLVAGLFMIVEALNRAGMMRLTRAGLAWLAAAPDGVGKFCGGFGIALLQRDEQPAGGFGGGNGAAADGAARAAGARGDDRRGPGAEFIGDGIAGDDPVADCVTPGGGGDYGLGVFESGIGGDAGGVGDGFAGVALAGSWSRFVQCWTVYNWRCQQWKTPTAFWKGGRCSRSPRS